MTDGTRETYIGDGVYASFDGFQIRLRTNRSGRDEVIYLDDETFAALLRFAQARRAHAEDSR